MFLLCVVGCVLACVWLCVCAGVRVCVCACVPARVSVQLHCKPGRGFVSVGVLFQEQHLRAAEASLEAGEEKISMSLLGIDRDKYLQ